MKDLNPHDYGELSRFLLDNAGMVLEVGKEYLVTARLVPVVTKYELHGLDALVEQIRRGNTALRADVIDAMTVNETSWFRDTGVWTALGSTLLPALIERRRTLRRLDVWCAASSSGQELYSLAILLNELLGPEANKWRIKILGTDISREMVQRTNAGVYSGHELSRGLSEARKRAYFSRTPGTNKWQVNDELRAMVSAREANLTSSDMGVRGPFDLIMIRNVLIYFEPKTRREVLIRSAEMLSPIGRLVLGASEGALGVPDCLAPERNATLVSYCRSDSDDSSAPPPQAPMSKLTQAAIDGHLGDEAAAAKAAPARPAPTAARPSNADALAALAGRAGANRPSASERSQGSTARPPGLRPTTPPSATPRPTLGARPGAAAAERAASPTSRLRPSADKPDEELTPLERLRKLRAEYQLDGND